jgi:7,8-dihydropterin-6-yl-methyl-4-(beta-D-ribofuranosyl)aminobenzene 5'-phosphate synthase
MRVTVISDNKALRRDLIAKHSLSLLVEHEFTYVLFDMAVDSAVLERNAEALEKPIDVVDYVVVSHEHTPHYGGYGYVAQEAPFTDVYIPYGSMESLGRLLLSSGLKPREVTKWTKLEEGVYVAGPYYGPPYEQFLVVELERGLVVFTGCTHPGVRVLREVASVMGKRIHAVIGGFHLSSAPLEVVERSVRELSELNPELIVPLHCSGELLAEALEKKGLNVIRGGAGLVLKI